MEVPQTSKKFSSDIQTRLEYRQSRTRAPDKKGHVAQWTLAEQAKSWDLIPNPSQRFVARLMHPSSSARRLLVKFTPGSGKTVTSLLSAMPYLDMQVQRRNSGQETGRVFIVGFTSEVFRNELLRFTNFGFINSSEIKKTRHLMATESPKLSEHVAQMRRRLTDRFNRGFFEFYGYKSLANRLFPGINIDKITASELLTRAQSGDIKINEELLQKFRNDSFLICDEIHKVYNSQEFNQWGVALQIIVQRTTCKALFMSATPHSVPREFVDTANLVADYSEWQSQPKKPRRTTDSNGPQTLASDQIFSHDGGIWRPRSGAVEQLKQAFRGRVVFLHDNSNPEVYPTIKFRGSPLTNEYADLHVINCPATKLQQQAYAVSSKGQLGMDALYLCDWIIPLPERLLKTKRYPNAAVVECSLYGGKSKAARYLSFNTEEIKNLRFHPDVQKELGLEYNPDNDGFTDMGFFEYSNIRKFSAVFARFIQDIRKSVQSGGPKKRLVYHPVVRNSGVLAVAQLLSANGFIEHGTAPNDETLCVVCGKIRKEHSKSSSDESTDRTCKFVPAKYICIYADLEKGTVRRLLDAYNGQHNADGSKVSICIGSRMISESYDFKALREIYALRVDSMSEAIQLFGRGIRSRSHFWLPKKDRDIEISVYMMTLGKSGGTMDDNDDPVVGGLTPFPAEEDIDLTDSAKVSAIERKYRRKIVEWNIVLKLEKEVLHQSAIDGAVNFEINRPTERTNSDGILSVMPYTPDVELGTRVERLTHDAFYAGETVKMIKILIKQAFPSIYTCWTYDGLLRFIKNPNVRMQKKTPLGLEIIHSRMSKYDLSEIDELDFVAALDGLVYDQQSMLINYERSSFYDRMSNDQDKVILLPGGGSGIIVHLKENVFCLAAVNQDGSPKFSIHSPFRLGTPFVPEFVDIGEYQRRLDPDVEFNINVVRFIETWEATRDLPFAEANKARNSYITCLFGIRFRRRLLEAAIEYIRHKRVSFNLPPGVKFMTFAKEIIEAFDRINAVAFDNTVDDPKARILRYLNDTTGPHGTKGKINPLSRSPARNGAPPLLNFATQLKRPMDKPVGHWLGETQRRLCRGAWKTITKEVDDRDENDIIVGYLDYNSSSDIVTRFKIRRPLHLIPKNDDSRRIERGSVCQSRPKEELSKIAQALKIPTKKNSILLSNAIMRQLMANEAAKKNNKRWWYF